MRNEKAGQAGTEAAQISGCCVTSLEAQNLACIRGGRLVFRDLDFALEAGCALAIEGPNGAGKTSLLRMIAGFLAPASGTIRLQTSASETSDGEERGKLCGWIGHHDGVKPQLSVAENLKFFAQLYGAEKPVESALSEAGLARLADLPGQYLSAGQKRRLALARLKLTNRPLWLMDEPLASLDAAGKKLASEMIASHCAQGGIVIAATHEPLGIDCARLVLGTT
jgi:heme exporter protein A